MAIPSSKEAFLHKEPSPKDVPEEVRAQLKFERVEPLAVWFAKRLANLMIQERLTADIVVPVALHRQRERERGYNQADLIARPLARQLRLPYRAVLLMRTKPRPDKHILSLSERWESVRGAFATLQAPKLTIYASYR